MINQIGNSGSFDSPRKTETSKLEGTPFEKIQQIEEEDPLFKRKSQVPFPLPEFLDPFLNRGPADPARAALPEMAIVGIANERPNNLAIPPQGFERIANDVIATPPKFPPPKVDEPLSRTLSRSSKELPQSDQFWEDFDMPDDPPPHRNFQEEELPPAARQEKREEARHRPEEARGLSSEEELFGVRIPKSVVLKPISPEERLERMKTESIGPALPIPDPLPFHIAAIAQKAEAAASTHLNPQIDALFRNMVGSIVLVQKTMPGVSRTEIILNASDLKGSLFYNTSIVIESHASAPGSFNICLIGSPEAVQIFNANLPSLTSAFTAAYESKEINFRIGRLETALSSKWSSTPRKQRGRNTDSDRFEE